MPISSQAKRVIFWKVQRLGRDTFWVNNVRRLLKREPKRHAPDREIEGEDIVRYSSENWRLTPVDARNLAMEQEGYHINHGK